jgi:hypothetical protein
MARLLAAVLLIVTAACGPRQVEVRTAPQGTTALPAVQVNNNLAQAVNVYVVYGGTDTFLRQVGARAAQRIEVQNVPAGSTVTLRGVAADGTTTYTRQNIVLSGTVTFTIP